MDIKNDNFFDEDPMSATNAENVAETPAETVAATTAQPTFKSLGMHDTEAIRFPLPDRDYKNGKLKKVRGRMLKKLLKYELKYMLLPMLVVAGLVLVVALLFGLQLRSFANVSGPVNGMEANEVVSSFVLFIVLYGLANMTLLLLPIGLAESRMSKNFFKGEGALTFSIPASAEEHLWAKHLGAVIAEGIAIVTAFVGCVLLILLAGGTFSDGGSTQVPVEQVNVVSDIFDMIEWILSMGEWLIGFPVVIGAFTCFMRKFTRKQQTLLVFAIVFGISFLSSVITTMTYTTDLLLFLATDLGSHLLSWGMLLLGAGFIALCYWYELRTIKYKINL